MLQRPFDWEREPTPEGDQIPADGVWVSEFDDHTQTYMISGPEGESESGEYTAVEQTGRASQILAVETQVTANAALASANGKSTVHYDTLAPSVDGKVIGDIWFQRAEVGLETITGAWVWAENSAGVPRWIPTSFGDEVLDSLTASKITTGMLAVGASITVGSPTGAHSVLTSKGIAFKADPDGSGVREVAQMGTATADVWSVTGPVQSSQDGDVYPVLAQATADGDVIAQNLHAANDVYVGGESLLGVIGSAIPKPVAMRTTGRDLTTSDKTWLNASEVMFAMRSNHLYQIVLAGRWGLDTAADGRLEMALSYSYAPDKAGVPQAAWVNATWSTRIATWGQSVDAHMENGAKSGFSFTHWLLGWGDRDNLKMAFAFVNWGSAAQVRLAQGARIVVLDHGPVGSELQAGHDLNAPTPAAALPSGGGEQAPVVVEDKVQQWTITFTADALKSWRGGSSTTPLQHGVYGGVQRYSHMSMPDMSKVTGATEVLKVEVWLRCTHVRWSAGVDVAIGTSLNDTVTSPQTSGSYPERSRWRAGEAKWVELKGQVHKDRAKAGQLRGIVLGEGANGESMYAHFSMSASDVKLRVTYRK